MISNTKTSIYLQNNQKVFELVQYEYLCRKFEFTFRDVNGKVLSLDDCMSVSYLAVKPDNNILGYELTVNKDTNTAVFETPLQLTTCVGLVRGLIEVRFNGSDGNLRYYGINFKIVPAVNDAEIESTSEFRALDLLTDEVKTLIEKNEDMLESKADKNDVYTKDEIDSALSSIIDSVDAKADSESVYNKTETNKLLSVKSNSKHISSIVTSRNELISYNDYTTRYDGTLSGENFVGYFGIESSGSEVGFIMWFMPYTIPGNVYFRYVLLEDGTFWNVKSASNIVQIQYSSAQVDRKLAVKADTETVNAGLLEKADKSDTYTKDEIDSVIKNINATLDNKADSDNVYDKSETDSKINDLGDMLDTKANTDDVYDKSEIDNQLAEKYDASNIENGVCDFTNTSEYASNVTNLSGKYQKVGTFALVQFTFNTSLTATLTSPISITIGNLPYQNEARISTISISSTTGNICPVYVSSYSSDLTVTLPSGIKNGERIATSLIYKIYK